MFVELTPFVFFRPAYEKRAKFWKSLQSMIFNNGSDEYTRARANDSSAYACMFLSYHPSAHLRCPSLAPRRLDLIDWIRLVILYLQLITAWFFCRGAQGGMPERSWI